MVANPATTTLVSLQKPRASSRSQAWNHRGSESEISLLLREVRDDQPQRVSVAWGWGLDARKHLRPQAAGEECLLTSPFIGLPDGPEPGTIADFSNRPICLSWRRKRHDYDWEVGRLAAEIWLSCLTPVKSFDLVTEVGDLLFDWEYTVS